jgi:hypothetical protein
LTVFGDRGFIRAALARQLLSDNRLNLSTLPRAHQTNQPSQTVSRTCNAIRQIIEPVNGQVTEQFHSQVKHAHPLWGGVLGYSPN